MKTPREKVDTNKGGEMGVELTSGDDRLWTVKEAAHFLKLSPLSLYHLISQHRVPVIRLSSRCVRFSRRSLEVWIAGMAVPAESMDPTRVVKK